MSRIVEKSSSATAVPSSYDSGYQAYSVSNLTNAYANQSSTTYAQINLTRNSGAVTQIYYNFSVTGIPSDAEITSVSCACKCSISTTTASRVTTRQAQLYAGSTAKGTPYNVPNSTTAYTIDGGTSWTLSDIQDLKIRLYAVRGTSNVTTNYYFCFYGATVTVNYTYDETEYQVTLTSNVSGVVFDQASQSQYEEFWVASGGTTNIKIFGLSDLASIIATDNNTNVTSSLVYDDDIYLYVISSIATDHTFVINPGIVPASWPVYIKINGSWVQSSEVYVKVNGSWQTVGTVYKKGENGWEQVEKQAMFSSPGVLYMKGT